MTHGGAAPSVLGMRSVSSALLLLSFAAGGCASAVDPKLVYGTYTVMVSAFGKSDPTIVVASEGSDGTILLNFTYGITTDYNAVNASGLRSHVDGSELKLDSQPLHVDHSTGAIDGTVIGVGTAGGAKLALTLKVTPSNVTTINGMPYVAGTTIDYEVDGPKQ